MWNVKSGGGFATAPQNYMPFPPQTKTQCLWIACSPCRESVSLDKRYFLFFNNFCLFDLAKIEDLFKGRRRFHRSRLFRHFVHIQLSITLTCRDSIKCLLWKSIGNFMLNCDNFIIIKHNTNIQMSY